MTQTNDAAERSAHVTRGVVQSGGVVLPLIRETKNEKGQTVAQLECVVQLEARLARLRAACAAVVRAGDTAPPVQLIQHIGAAIEQCRQALKEDDDASRPPPSPLS